MPTDEVELSRRTKLALDAIKRSLDTDADEFGVRFFATHHLEQIDQSYWQARLGTHQPTPAQVIGLLCLRSHWSADDEDGLDTLDFTLPDDVTNYVLGVSFDKNGEISEISMES